MAMSTHRPARLFFGMVVAVALGPVGLSLVGAQAEKAAPVFTDGMAQIVPGFQDPSQWIHDKLWVETEFDSDGDGARDRMFTDVPPAADRERRVEGAGDLRVVAVLRRHVERSRADSGM